MKTMFDAHQLLVLDPPLDLPGQFSVLLALGRVQELVDERQHVLAESVVQLLLVNRQHCARKSVKNQPARGKAKVVFSQM